NAVFFKFTNAVCDSYNESWFVIHKCRLHAVSRNKTTFNFNGTVLHPAYKISLFGQILRKASGYKPWILKTSIDVCRFVNNPYDLTAKVVFALFKEFTNFNHSCPYNGTQLVRNLYPRLDLLQLPFPTGEYLLSVKWSFDNRPQFITDVYFEFKEDF
ncbi:hypothetical protein KR093_006341, partial [Drosophila rubida]